MIARCAENAVASTARREDGVLSEFELNNVSSKKIGTGAHPWRNQREREKRSEQKISKVFCAECDYMEVRILKKKNQGNQEG